MGLALHYELRLPASTSRESAAEKLRELHAFAATLPSEKIAPLLVDDGENFCNDGEWREALRFWASIVAEPYGDETPALTGDPNSAMGIPGASGTRLRDGVVWLAAPLRCNWRECGLVLVRLLQNAVRVNCQ